MIRLWRDGMQPLAGVDLGRKALKKALRNAVPVRFDYYFLIEFMKSGILMFNSGTVLSVGTVGAVGR